MRYDDLPEYYLPYFDNFTGPGWSDGKWQSSTSRATKKALTKLDTHSKRHDSDYALCDSLSCLDDADELYSRSTSKMSFVPRTIGKMPLYGNAPVRYIYKALGLSYRGADAGVKMGQSESVYIDAHGNQYVGRAADLAREQRQQAPGSGFSDAFDAAGRAMKGDPSLRGVDVEPQMMATTNGNNELVCHAPEMEYTAEGKFVPARGAPSEALEQGRYQFRVPSMFGRRRKKRRSRVQRYGWLGSKNG